MHYNEEYPSRRDQILYMTCANYPFEPHVIVLGIKNFASNVIRQDIIIKEGECQKLGVKLRMVWWAIKDQVTNTTQLVPSSCIGWVSLPVTPNSLRSKYLLKK